MPDFAPNYTVRYKLHYSALGKNHTALVRATRGSGAAGAFGARDRLFAMLNGISAARYVNTQVLSGEYALEDSDIFAPDPALPALTAGAVANPTNAISESSFAISFVGRSSLGQKARLFVYGTAFSPEVANATYDDFRIKSAENSTILGAVALLNGGTGLAASDNAIITWYQYANGKYNDYWVKRQRG
jgi:hypothetical protein